MLGRVTDLRTGVAIAGCTITGTHTQTGATLSTHSGESGVYLIAPLSPGTYRTQVQCAGHQSQESYNLQLGVASALLIDFQLRPLEDVWEDNYRRLLVLPNKSVLMIYGPDLDMSHTGVFDPVRGAPGALEATVSQVIDTRLLRELPLQGRDAYTMLVTQPGVTSDSTTTRSIGLSANGQRPSSAEFLLDGLENNDALVTGPLSSIAPESLSEYRISTNNFSAEYGRTSGFLANAVTRGGTTHFHGLGYFYARHEALMARYVPVPGADFAAPFREIQPGFTLTGPIFRRLLGSMAFESTRVYTRQPAQVFTIPTSSYIAGLTPSTLAYTWLHAYAPPPIAGAGDTADITVAPPVHINRTIVVPRLDWSTADGVHHVMARYARFALERPDFEYSPYEGFSTPLRRTTDSVAGAWTMSRTSSLVNELRLGWNRDLFSALRPHPEIPALAIAATRETPLGVTLPTTGSSNYGFENRTRNIELDDNLGLYGHKHVVRIGAAYLPRDVSGILSAYASGWFSFAGLADFAKDAPQFVELPLRRADPVQPALPDFDRQYRLRDWDVFAQDSFRPFERLTLSAGVRYDRFGAPANSGSVKDVLFQLNGDLRSSGDQLLYRAGTNGWAVRLGTSYAFDANARTVVRAAFGQFLDRPFDNLWQTVRNNSYLLLLTGIPIETRDYTNFSKLLTSLPSLPVRTDFPDLTTFPNILEPPRVRSWMIGVQRAASPRLFLEANILGSSSANLIATDRLNRQATLSSTEDNPGGRPMPALPDIIFRGNQGRSEYRAATVLARYRSPRLLVQGSYTFSNAWDNQSDPMAGEFFELGFGSADLSPKAAFTQASNPAGDWGNADFDQRHNFVAFAVWNLPGPLHEWQASTLGAVRSGFPFTVSAGGTGVTPLLHNPADLVPGVPVWTRQASGGGVLLLNAAAFTPASGIGNSGRNAFYGPGLFSADLSLSRRFRPRWLPEGTEIVVRADAYNALNHLNLGNPQSDLDQENFGVAHWGRDSRPNAFRLLGPLAETRRQFHLMLRFAF